MKKHKLLKERQKNGKKQYQVEFENGLVTEWLDNIATFDEKGMAFLLKDSKFNYMNEKGRLLFERWKECHMFFLEEGVGITKNKRTFHFWSSEGLLAETYDLLVEKKMMLARKKEGWAIITPRCEPLNEEGFVLRGVKVLTESTLIAEKRAGIGEAFFDEYGKQISPWFKEISLEKDVCRVKSGEKEALFDLKGKQISLWYDYYQNVGNLWCITEGRKKALYSTKERRLRTFWYDSIIKINDNLFNIKEGDKSALFNDKGERITKWYDEISYIQGEEVFCIRDKNQYNFMNKKGEFIYPEWEKGQKIHMYCGIYVQDGKKIVVYDLQNQTKEELEDVEIFTYDDMTYFVKKSLDKMKIFSQQGKMLVDYSSQNIELQKIIYIKENTAIISVLVDNNLRYVIVQGDHWDEIFYDKILYNIEKGRRIAIKDNLCYPVFNGNVFRQGCEELCKIDYGFAWIKIKGKYNYLSENAKLLSNEWFDEIRPFVKIKEGCYTARIKKNKWNLLTQDGRILLEEWVEKISPFFKWNGSYFAIVSKDSKEAIVNALTGEVVGGEWCEHVNIQLKPQDVWIDAYTSPENVKADDWRNVEAQASFEQ